ncbi:MAG TPA: GGDEF domain-containing protein [Halothiobacillus sp.]|nr:MAG: hypothetical protein B7Z82_00575 [Halothiobacillus sp. 20-54-6]HQT43404.1 GGDEF domain-containing protein [Halothiobacillus sp.]
MQFDIRTLLVAVTLATAFCAGARILLWRMHRGIPGVGQWAWAGVLGVPALILIAASDAMPQMLSLSLAQILIATGIVLAWDGFRRFIGRAALSPLTLGLLAMGVLSPLAIAHIGQSLTMRAALNALVIALISALIARELLFAAKSGQSAMRATGWLYAFNAAFFLVRAIIAIARGDEPVGQLNPDGFAAVTLLWWLCMTVAVTLGMVLMTGERLQRVLDRQASRDPLTGALNRRAFSVVAEKVVAHARRNGQPLSVLMMDLDHFKLVNDHFGHGGGDDVLCRFVAAADRVLRGEDVFCRFGGEEFVALLSGSSADRAQAVAERLRAVYAEEAATAADVAHPPPFTFSVSVGVAELRAGEGIDSAIRRADKALYQAKAMGRNRCELADDGLGAAATV